MRLIQTLGQGIIAGISANYSNDDNVKYYKGIHMKNVSNTVNQILCTTNLYRDLLGIN